MYNNGPDAAGTIPGTYETIYVIDDGVRVNSKPLPFDVVDPIDGCRVERISSERLTDGTFVYQTIFHFGSIAAGHSRTCTYDMKFLPSIRASLSDGWVVHTVNDADANTANDRVEYTFLLRHVPIPAASRFALLLLALGLLAAAHRFRRQMKAE